MADEPIAQPADAGTGEQTPADSAPVEQPTGEQPAEPADKPSEPDKGQEEAPKAPEAKAVPEKKPISRRSAEYRIQQLTQEVKELKAEKAKKPADNEEDWEDQPAEQPKQPDIAAMVQAEVEKRLKPLESATTKAADDAELAELFTGDRAGERSKYEPRIREMWKLPQYHNLSAEDAYILASHDSVVHAAVTKAIEDYKQAEKDAKENSTGGTPARSKTGKETNAWDLSDKEFQEKVSKARSAG